MGLKYIAVFTVFLLLLPTVLGTVVVNSKDWHDIYLGSIHAYQNDEKLIYFDSLGDAQIQTKLIPTNERVLILESGRPVVKNYRSFLEVGGYEGVETIEYSDYTELQAELYGESDKYLVLYPGFAAEAIAAAPLMLVDGYAPLFLNEGNQESVRDLTAGADTLVAGRFPVRWTSGVSGEKLTGKPLENAKELMERSAAATDSDWGILSRADRFDPQTLAGGKPVLLFGGDVDQLASWVSAVDIDRYEVIGADLADLATAVKDRTGRDLHLLLKYGQTITNVPGLEGQILNVRQVDVPAPVNRLEFVKLTRYPDAGTLALTLENTGTLESLFLVTLEYGDLGITEEQLHIIQPGETTTIPFVVNASEETDEATVNVRYGLEPPLEQTITGGDGPILRADVEQGSAGDGAVQVRGVRYDGDEGVLYVDVKNNGGEALVDAELLLDPPLSGAPQTIPAGESATLEIATPFLAPDALVEETHPLALYYGEGEISRYHEADVTIEAVSEGSTMYLLLGAIAIFICILVTWLVIRKRGRE